MSKIEHKEPIRTHNKHTLTQRRCVSPLSHLVVLFDDVLRCQTVVLQVSSQVEHVVSELLLQVVVMLQDGFQLCSRLTFIQRETSAKWQVTLSSQKG